MIQELFNLLHIDFVVLIFGVRGSRRLVDNVSKVEIIVNLIGLHGEHVLLRGDKLIVDFPGALILYRLSFFDLEVVHLYGADALVHAHYHGFAQH